MAMAMKLSCEADVLLDLKWAKEMGICLDDKLDKCRRFVEEIDIDSEYRNLLSLVLDEAKTYERNQRKRGSVCIDLVEDSDGVKDPQCKVNSKADAEELNRMGKGHLCHMPGRRDKGKRVVKEEDTHSEYQHFLGSVLGKGKINERHKRKRGRVYMNLVEDSDGVSDTLCMVNHKADAAELTRLDKGRLCHFPGRRYNRVTENLIGKCGDQAQPREKEKGKNVICQDGGAYKKIVTRSENVRLRRKLCQKNNRLIQCQNELVDRARSVEKYKEHMGEKFKGRNKVKIEPKIENLHQGRRSNLVVRSHSERVDRELTNVCKGKSGLSHEKAAFENYFVKNESDKGVKTRSHTKEVRSRVGSFQTASGKDVVHNQRKLIQVDKGDRGLSAFGNYSMKNEPNEGVRTRLRMKEVQIKGRTVKTSKWLVTHTKGSKMITESNVEILPDLEILDSAAITEGRMLSPFELANTYENLPNPHCPILDDFRMELLKVLNKPFDTEEYKQHREEIRIGSYFKHYPDLANKLKVHRYKRKKCMTILRGFFFWLQNVTREGSFKPWKDRECLAVEPGPPQNFSPGILQRLKYLDHEN